MSHEHRFKKVLMLKDIKSSQSSWYLAQKSGCANDGCIIFLVNVATGLDLD
ncbi:hypothetical protein N6G94_05010 [Pediococcus inopinatus]|uniref:hypothetical protein n=1 Tax=Pediococcus inopinatus TaxID=114090 RepID=UPI002B26095D|nr:hypothetical protein [Pediococcus inopinatus]WPC18357.1 hypothetical protein N6G94_05010 [Pediococcus inopinatus]